MNNINIKTIKTEEFTLNGDKNKVIYFAPTDINIFNRYNACTIELQEKLKEYDNIYKLEINDKTDFETTMEIFNQINDADKFIKEKIDYIFNSKISEVIFGNTCCLSLNSNGEFVFQTVLETLFNICNEKIGEKTKSDIKQIKQNPKAQAYLNKYNNHNKHNKNVKKYDNKKSN